MAINNLVSKGSHVLYSWMHRLRWWVATCLKLADQGIFFFVIVIGRSYISISTPSRLRVFFLRNWELSCLFNVWTWNSTFPDQKGYAVLVILWWVLWRNPYFKSDWWYGRTWNTTRIEQCLQKRQIISTKKVDRTVEFRNALIVLLKLPTEVMLFNTLSMHLSLGSQLVYCLRDAKYPPCGHFVIDFYHRTDNNLDYCTHSGSILPKFSIPERLTFIESLVNKNWTFLYSPSVPIFFRVMQNSFSLTVYQSIVPLSSRLLNESARKMIKQHKAESLKLKADVFSVENNFWKQSIR